MIFKTDILKSELEEDLKKRQNKLKSKGIDSCLAIIRFGDKKADLSYEKGLEKSAKTIGLNLEKHIFTEEAKIEEVLNTINILNKNERVGGILVFRPLPIGLNEERINEAILAEKDVDCVNPKNLHNLLLGKEGKLPATAKSALRILKNIFPKIEGKDILIVNRSMVIGKPLALMLLKENATVTIAHSKTRDLESKMKEFDAVVLGMGQGNMINKGYVNKDSILVDCGINFIDEKLVGDVDLADVSETVKLVTPVPGGVGSLTNLLLIESVIETLEV